MISTTTTTRSNVCEDDVWPPGFRFHPTDEELILYYLKRKICRRKLKLDIIAEVDVYKWEPEELPELSSLKNGDRQWFFFSPRDRKYPNGSRANRATRQGYWKATGKDRTITCNSRDVGIKKTLVFYRGRAPTGQRTDWVMHEYTLEEEELKRCQNVQDYYAIYKMFKKSGPGPKNGEQYGAPFREEDWADDDCLKNSRNCNQVNSTQLDNVSPAESCRNAQVDVLETDVGELLNDMVDDQAQWPVNLDDFEQALSQLIHEEENQCNVNASVGEAVYADPCMAYNLGPQHNNFTPNFSVGGSWDATEVTSAVNSEFTPEITSTASQEFANPLLNEDDFLEMNDLLGPEPVQAPPIQAQQAMSVFENAQLRDGDGFDLYYDTDLFLGDFVSDAQSVPPPQYQRPHEDGVVNHGGLYSDDVSSFRNETWNYEATSYLQNPIEASNTTIPLQSSGVVYTGGSGNLIPGSNQNQNEKQTQQAQPWLSSTLWSFVESIPAAPASAAESALASKAFKRMSSFSRVRIHSKSAVIAAGRAGKSASAGVGSRIKGFFVFSFLAAFLAVVCVFIGSHSSVFGKLHCRMNL